MKLILCHSENIIVADCYKNSLSVFITHDPNGDKLTEIYFCSWNSDNEKNVLYKSELVENEFVGIGVGDNADDCNECIQNLLANCDGNTRNGQYHLGIELIHDSHTVFAPFMDKRVITILITSNDCFSNILFTGMDFENCINGKHIEWYNSAMKLNDSLVVGFKKSK